MTTTYTYRFTCYKGGTTYFTEDVTVSSQLSTLSAPSRTIRWNTGSGWADGYGINASFISKSKKLFLVFWRSAQSNISSGNSSACYKIDQTYGTTVLDVTLEWTLVSTNSKYTYSFTSDGTGKVSAGSVSLTLTTPGSAQSATITFTPNSNRTLKGWYYNNNLISTSESLTVTAGSSAEGTYTAKTHPTTVKVSVNASGKEGSAYASKSSSATSGSASVDIAYSTGTAYIFAKPTSIGKFLQWADGNTSLSRSISGLTSNTTYTARFSTTYVKVEANPSSLGRVVVGASGSKRYYASGDSVKVVASANSTSIDFSGWYVGNTRVGTSLTYSFIFSGSSITLQARFHKRERRYRALSSNSTYGVVAIKPGGAGAASVDPDYVASFGEKLAFDAAIKQGTINGTAFRGAFLGWYLSSDTGFLNPISKRPTFEITVPEKVNGVISYDTITYVARFIEAGRLTVGTNVSDGTSLVSDRGVVRLVNYSGLISQSGTNYVAYIGTMTFQIIPPSGFHVAGWKLNGVEQENATGNSFSALITANSVVTAIVVKNVYTVNCAVDEKSLGCGTCVLQVKQGGEYVVPPNNTVEYGTDCRIRTTASTISGHTFLFRRLTSGGNGLETNNSSEGVYDYIFRATRSMSFVAYFGDVFTVVAKHIYDGNWEDETYGHAFVSNGSESQSQASSTDFTFGDTLKLRAENSVSEETPAYFVGWHSVASGVPSYDRITGLFANSTVVPTVSSSKEYWAEFSNETEVDAICVSNNGTTFGDLSVIAIDDPGDVREVSLAEYASALKSYYSLPVISPAPADATVAGVQNDGSNKFYLVRLGARILLSCTVASSNAEVEFDAWEIKNYLGLDTTTGAAQLTSPAAYNVAADAEHIVAGNAIFLATYKSSLPAKVILEYGDSSSSVEGVLRLSPLGDNPVQFDNIVSGDYIPNTLVTATAFPKNGYVFDGWYYDEPCANMVYLADGETPAPESYTFVKSSAPQTFYAKFSQDDNGIFAWEGDTANKLMTWRSRRVQMAQPINFSSAAVSADGYPLQLSVAYASSPNPEENGWRECDIHINNQDPRRLPIVRPERYTEVEIESDKPVLRVAVSTSMHGLMG